MQTAKVTKAVTLLAGMVREQREAGWRAAVAVVRKIHSRNTAFPHYCRHCRAPWPCRTLTALAEAVNKDGDP